MGGCSDPKQQVTTMVLEVDLDCCQCYKKVKRLLCKFPQIRDQVYDKKQNTVTITVVCCSPEKIRDKLCCKGGKFINSIEIKEPKKPPDVKPIVTTPTPVPEPPCWPLCQVFLVSACCDSCYHGLPGGPCYHGYGPGPGYAYSYGRPPCRCDYFSEENPNSACSIM